MMNGCWKNTVILALCCMPMALQAKAPYVDPSNDENNLGSPARILFWTPEQQVAGYRNIDRIFPVRRVAAAEAPLELPETPLDLGSVSVEFPGHSMTVDEYFVQQNVAGLLVLKGGKIAYERYGLGNTRDSRWISFSVTKSVVSMLVGAAIRDGYIDNVDEKVSDYLPRLKGSPYDESTLRNILQMASGVEWNEDYADPASDVNSASWQTVALYDYLAQKQRQSPPGREFNYNTAETNLVGTLLRSAIGNNLSTYLQEKIWRPFGMESDAVWTLTEPGGGEFGGCCISATLRDYGRLGLFALHQGRLPDGSSVLPEGWMEESTVPSKGYPGYGYLWWLGRGGAYRAIGIFGQGICVHPEQNVVVALHSARRVASRDEDWALQEALCHSLAGALER
ncbi:MAG: serine hydrolase [Xanthomonadales bacterium]|nr:beta-lactamase family protein [Gammaproteobacteria bacterium]NND56201.1 serine hydrolase [Xanthomonadales bacterium]NNK51553.1 serine hydrolase [Xanthomonadales bacterium]